MTVIRERNFLKKAFSLVLSFQKLQYKKDFTREVLFNFSVKLDNIALTAAEDPSAVAKRLRSATESVGR